MKLFGSLTELFQEIFRKNSQAITLRPNQTVTYTASRDVQFPQEDANSILTSRTSTDTLTNKSIDGGTNTLTNVPASALSGVVAPDHGGLGVANNVASTLAISGNFATTLTVTAPTGVTLPTTGTLATLAGAESLSNKTLVAPLLSSYEDLSEISTPANPAAAKLRVYAKSDDKLYTLNSAGIETPVGSGSGSKNYVTSPDNAGNWATSGAGVTVATDTTSADLPEPSKGSGIKITPVSGTDNAHFQFKIDPADKNKKLGITLDIKSNSGYASGDLVLEVWAADNLGFSTNVQQLPVDNNSILKSDSGGTLNYSVDSNGQDYVQLRITRVSGTSFIVISGVSIGPGQVVSASAVSEWSDYVPAYSAGAVVSTQKIRYRQVGSALEIQGRLAFGNASGGTTFTVGLPPGYSIDVATYVTGDSVSLGVCNFYQAPNFYWGYVTVNGNPNSTSIQFMTSYNIADSGGSRVHEFQGSDPNNANELSFSALVQVQELAGHGLLNLLQEDNLTGWKSYVPTISGVGSPTNVAFKWRRVGSQLELTGKFTVDTTSAAVVDISLPPGLNIDTTDLVGNTRAFGDWHALGTGGTAALFASTISGVCTYSGGGTNAVRMSSNITSSTYETTLANAFLSASEPVDIPFLSIPIAEFKNSQNGLVGFAGATSTQLGLVRANKQYVLDTVYTNGTPTGVFAGGFAGYITIRGVVMPYQTVDGAWRMAFNLGFSGGASNGGSVGFSGSTFKNVANYFQAVSAFAVSGGGAPAIAGGYAVPGNATATLQTAGATATVWTMSGDCEIDGKPTWAD